MPEGKYKILSADFCTSPFKCDSISVSEPFGPFWGPKKKIPSSSSSRFRLRIFPRASFFRDEYFSFQNFSHSREIGYSKFISLTANPFFLCIEKKTTRFFFSTYFITCDQTRTSACPSDDFFFISLSLSLLEVIRLCALAHCCCQIALKISHRIDCTLILPNSLFRRFSGHSQR